MSLRLGSTVINCADLELMTDFWSQALALRPTSRAPEDRFRLLQGEQGNLSLQRASSAVRARDQMHLDLYSDDLEAQLERLTTLGAVVLRRVSDEHETYVVLRDPEGNEFCVCEKPAV